MLIPHKDVSLKEFSIDEFDFSIYIEDSSVYIGLEDLLYATLIENGLTTQLLSLMSPPQGYYSLIDIKECYQLIDSENDYITLSKIPFVEIHGAIALMRLALQERPENTEVLDVIKAMKAEYNLTREDDEIVDYILSNPWLQKRLG